MITSPITLDIGADSVTLNRINQDGYSSEYFGRLPSGDEVRMKVRNLSTKAKGLVPSTERHSAELLVAKKDPVTGSVSQYQGYFVFTAPKGADSDMAVAVAAAILEFGTLANLNAMADWAS